MRKWRLSRNADLIDDCERQIREKHICYGKDTPSAPPAPDYTGAAVAQGAANKESAIASAQLSNPNVTNWNGSQTVSYQNDPTTGNPVPYVNQTLNPQSQQIYNAQQATKLGLANLANTGENIAQGTLNSPFSFGGNVQTGLNTSGVAQMPVNAGTTGYDAIMSRLEPQMARQQASADTQLTNQGLRPGGEAWTNAQTDLRNQQNDQRTQAALQGINLDMSANNQGYNQALQSGQFGNSANQQALAQALTLRQAPLNEINALTSSSQINAPQFNGYQGVNVAPANYQQAAQNQAQYGQGMYNAQLGQQNAMTGGLFSLGAAGLGNAKNIASLFAAG